MVIFFESGRLGNQLFQYVALRSFFPRPEKIVLVGFDSLKNTFDGVDAVFINKSNWLIAFLMRVVRKLERMGWLDHIFNVGFESEFEPESECKSKIIIKKRISWVNIVYFKESYFQSEYFLDDTVIDRLEFKLNILEQLSGMQQLNTDRSNLFFIHVRRGDYLYWPSLDCPAVLDDFWYLKTIEKINKCRVSAKFIFFSDDPSYVRHHLLRKIPNADILHISEAIDLAAMTFCGGGGVLSASSFAWWAARLSKNYQAHKNFIAPKFWCGHSRQEWIPKNIKTTFLQYEN